MSGCSWLPGAVPPVTHTDALFAEQSQSILDNLVARRGAAERGIARLGTAAVLSGISRHSSEGDDALTSWHRHIGCEPVPVERGRRHPCGGASASRPKTDCGVLKPGSVNSPSAAHSS